MNTVISRSFGALILALFVLITAASARDYPSMPALDIPSPPLAMKIPADIIEVIVSAPAWSDADIADQSSGSGVHFRARDDDNDLVSVGDDSTLAAGEQAESVVSVFGSSTSAGDVSRDVVSVGGNTHVTGPVGKDVVAVMGNVYLNSKIGGDAVAVLGNVELGPQAQVGGEVVVVGGRLLRDPASVVHGGVQQVMAGKYFDFGWLRPWIDNCLMYARPLAIAPGLGWAWAVAIGFLIFYAFLALVFRGAMDRCAQTLETRPGLSVVAAILSLLLTPVVFILLFITVIGIALVPFLMAALFCAGLFGKSVILAAIGRRFTGFFGNTALAHTAIAVLIGGVIVLALYLVPVVGFIVYKLIGFLGLGVVIYTLILAMKSGKAAAGASEFATAYQSPPIATAAVTDATSDASAADTVTTESAASSSSTAPAALTTLPHAGFWIRMGALLIDIILIGILFGVVSDMDGLWLVVLAAYGAIMWKLKGTTIGGIVFNLKVVRQDGRPVDWATTIVRALSCFLSLVVAGLGFIWIALDEEKQAWHDKIAGTVVVRVPKGVSLL